MQTLHRNMSVFQQTKMLLWKNVLTKWRRKRQSFQEWILSLLFLSLVYVVSLNSHFFFRRDIPYAFLGQLNGSTSDVTLISYTPVTSTTKEIMNKVASKSVMIGIRIEGVEDEKFLEEGEHSQHDFFGVVFKDDLSYHLRHSWKTPFPNDDFGHIDLCYNFSATYCKNPEYWYEGFVALQSSIDAAIIEMKTNHSVWKEMKSISGVRMQSSSLLNSMVWGIYFTLVFIAMCFSAFLQVLSTNMTREKKNIKVLMKMMGLQDSAFWLSWSLLYTAYVFIMSCLMTVVSFYDEFYLSSFFPIVFLFLLYGISSIHFTFLISSIFKKPKTTSSAVFLLSFLSGILSIITLLGKPPVAFEWVFGFLSPFVFNAGIAKIFHLERYGIGFYFSNLMDESSFLLKIYIILIIDSVLYMLLAVYFDKVLPDKYGTPYSPLFFLKSSYWVKSQRRYDSGRSEFEQNCDHAFGDDVEPVPPEFAGKEAIRLCNIKKTYGKKEKQVEALGGLSLNIYEGQITALLGHSGAGKTTLLNVLSGLTEASEGSATIFSHRLSEVRDKDRIKERIGFCPQFNLQFEALTVKENLRVFAGIKGILSSETEREVKNVLTQLDMIHIQDKQADKISSGQKRSLSLGIAMLGNPQVLLLDEPTAGMDLSSRYQVWNLLKDGKAGRVTLFSTQFMDEADILADRKAFISHGKLKCVGSSLFLKKKWGIGYHLRMHTSELCHSEEMTSLVKEYIPNATFSGQRENELEYVLPLETVDTFPDLFCGLDNHSDQGIINYGVTMTSLEDVFLKLEGEEAIAEGTSSLLGDGILGEEQAEEEKEPFSVDGVEQNLSLSDFQRTTVTGMALWRQQVCAMARLRLLRLKKASKTFKSILLLYTILLLPLILEFLLIGIWFLHKSWEMSSALYFRPLGMKADKENKDYTSLLILNETGSTIDDFILNLEKQNIALDITSKENKMERLMHNGAIKVSRDNQSYNFTILCHLEVINCYPVLMNIISNALLGASNFTGHIQVWNSPFFKIHDGFWDYFVNFLLTYMLLLLPGFFPQFTMNHIQDYKRKARSQLRISGLFPSAYWCGQALVDIALAWILVISMFGMYFAMSSARTWDVSLVFSLIACCIGYGVSMVLFLYLIAFIFCKGCSTLFLSCALIAVTTAALTFSEILKYTFSIRIFNFFFFFFIPMYPLIGFIITAPEIFDSYRSVDNSRSELFVSIFAPYIHCVAFIFLLRYLEMKYGRAVLRGDPVFRISPRKEPCYQNPEEPEEEDEDVQMERAKIRHAIASQHEGEKPLIIVNNLRKEYEVKKAGSVFKNKKKVCVKNISFCVKKGEIFGLLGPSGAGKSTTINMITGETTLSAGQVLAKGKGAAESQLEASAPGFLSYCPQENPLWPTLTVQEHLEVYAAVKGLRKEDAAVTIFRILKALELQKYFKKAAGELPAWITRKLCVALSLLGNPTFVLLDEPSAGMDPRGQSQVWKVIRSALKSKEQGAILTTHCMEEAEAVCDRVAILVSGWIQCIGSIQYLKSKFGKSYLLEIKLKDSGQADQVHTEILRIFPQAARQERFSSLLVYKVPMEDALPLSQAFCKMERAKRSIGFEEYTFSLNTLAQMVLELSREQKDTSDLDLDGNFEQNLFQQEDL
ncbi:ABC-type organic anion transporter ABCA8 isoform X1 [Alligator mississippiensis]|uniref:ABC-type organic anion transporter ABCA8 isoform X1 n=1 Tax=Alligator mississippiensis TaxID=8496 RepID=UPI000906FBCA|nr:ABC-type organic anion transporter ABCA8 isoform X1 [Alligator mississippiensis]XP_059588002.1 ABC-type organic anion transporter ABCA8 isoform X1 [Alligator mississippiensis]